MGSPRRLYVQMLFSFAALTFALPSASTRGSIMVHVYEQALGHWSVAASQSHPRATGRSIPIPSPPTVRKSAS